MRTFLGCNADFESASIVLFGAPFDSTTSYRPGARFAPDAMRSNSFGFETYSPRQGADLLDCSVQDGDDLELCFGDTAGALADIEAYAAGILGAGKLPFLIGGEHLVSLGAIRAAAKRHPDLHILHFDAHADLREEYLGAALSHAAVMRRAWELLGDGRIHQFGIRSGTREEFEWAGAHVDMSPFDLSGLDETLENLRDCPVYLTVDLDVLDPSVFPGTGTPEPGGVGYLELERALLRACKLNIVGADMVELSPVYDQSGASTAVACKLLRELLIALSAGRAKPADHR
ncbi:MAG: agmatinase [Bacillota bacterium]